MQWLEVRINTTQEAYDAVSEMLTDMGAGGVAIEDPEDIRRQIQTPNSLDYADEEFMNSLGEDVVVKAYFNESFEKDALTTQIQDRLRFISGFLDIGKGFEGVSYVDDEDWSNAWKKFYKPLHISERLVIKPSWEDYEPRDHEVVVVMDPGMAFGTGTHETTRMCAEFIEQYVKEDDTVLDVGCGTGILSIIAVKLGAGNVRAVDIDDTAVKVSRENFRINGVEGRIDVSAGVLTNLPENPADLVVANIIADVIVKISAQVPHYLKEGGLFITSGIIRERKEEVINACKQAGFRLIEEKVQGEWVAMVFKN